MANVWTGLAREPRIMAAHLAGMWRMNREKAMHDAFKARPDAQEAHAHVERARLANHRMVGFLKAAGVYANLAALTGIKE